MPNYKVPRAWNRNRKFGGFYLKLDLSNMKGVKGDMAVEPSKILEIRWQRYTAYVIAFSTYVQIQAMIRNSSICLKKTLTSYTNSSKTDRNDARFVEE